MCRWVADCEYFIPYIPLLYLLFNLTFVVFAVLQLNKTNSLCLCVRTLFPSFQFSSCLKCPPPWFFGPPLARNPGYATDCNVPLYWSALWNWVEVRFCVLFELYFTMLILRTSSFVKCLNHLHWNQSRTHNMPVHRLGLANPNLRTGRACSGTRLYWK